MVVIHIAYIDSSVIGGVQIAVPRMIQAQSNVFDVGLINIQGEKIHGIQMLDYRGEFDVDDYPPPYNKPDLIVFHEVYRFDYINLYKKVIQAKIPYIVIPHGCLSKQAQKRKYLKKMTANFLFFSNFLKSAHSIQYLSENERKMSAFSRFSSFVCGNGVELPENKKTNFFHCGIKFLYIGRLEIRTKGIDLLLSAVKECSNYLRHEEAKIYICGPDYNEEHYQIRKIIDELEITDLVVLEYEKTGQEKEDMLMSSDCFIQASRTEGLPMGPLEALGYGLPCIVTDGVGLGDLISRYGAGIKCNTSSHGIANAITCFLENRAEIKHMSEGAIKLIENNYDQTIIVQKTADKYRQIIGE